MALTLRYAARSDVGLKRPGNEDSGYADNHLLVVADGMGGHAAGELASSMAVATFAELAEAPIPDADLVDTLDGGVSTLTERIGDVIAADSTNQGMGTTITGLYFQSGRVAIVHVGDSRAYRLRHGKLEQLTKDHTYVQTLVDSGEITAEAATRHPRRNLLMRAVDGIHQVEADLSVRETRPGDRYLICSDGLSGVVPDTELAEVLREDVDPTGVVTRLVDLALEAGAPDNVTVAIADVQETKGNLHSGLPVVVGAAGEPANRAKLPNVPWPVDEQLDPDDPSPRQLNTNPPGRRDAEPTVPAKSGRPRWLVALLASLGGLIVILAIVGAALLWWVRGQWYVAADDGSVAIYHGVPGSLGPIPLSVVDTKTELRVQSLPSFDQDRVAEGIPTSSKERAEEVVLDLQGAASECVTDPATPGCPTVPGASTGSGKP